MLNHTTKTYLLLIVFIGFASIVYAHNTATNFDVHFPNMVADTTEALDKGWPREIETEDMAFIFHQPQITSLGDFTSVVGRVAIEAHLKDNSEEVFIGSILINAKVEIDFDTRSILIYDKSVDEIKFDNSNDAMTEKITNQLLSLQSSPEIISLDRVLPMIDEQFFDMDGIEANEEPPVIFYRDDPNSLLVILNGEPIWSPTERDQIKFAVNTNWPLYSYEKKGEFYLLNETEWLKATNIFGPWETTTSLPKEFKKLSKKDGWEDLKKVIPPKTSSKPTPRIFVSTKPAELLINFGPAKFKSIEGIEELKSVYNTDSDLFFYGVNNTYYLLLSGRWFSATSLSGPWTFATRDLPLAFSQLSEDSDWGHVLSSVPGTVQAKEAAIQAQLPQTAELSRDATPPEVKYDGDPKFAPIEGTDMTYATNSQNDIIYVDNNYYMCYQGAWFYSAYPSHGWVISTSVPGAIYTIPPSCPMYHVSYVRYYGHTSSHVTFGYTYGYMGIHVSYGVPIYGTGYYYPPYYYYPSHYGYPIYYPYHYSYGFRATYNPYTGAYARQARVYGPYGGAGRGAYYNPRTGTYARGRSAWGPYGGAGEAIAYNPRTGARGYGRTAQSYGEGRTQAGGYNARTGRYGATNQGHSPYAQWGESVVGKGDKWAHTGHYTDRNGTRYAFETSEGAKGAGFRGNDGNTGRVIRSNEGDLYVGNNGNVFKKEGDSWYKKDKDGWNSVSDKLNQEQKNKIQDGRSELSNRAQNVDKDKARSNIQNREKSKNRNLDSTRKPDKPRTRPQPKTQGNQSGAPYRRPSTQSNRATIPSRDYNARQRGTTRSQNYNNYQSQRGSRSSIQRSSPRTGGGARRGRR